MKENPIVKKDLEFFAEHVPFLDELRGKTFLVTGATGLIGSTFVKCMLTLNEKWSTGIQIVGMVRNPQKVADIFGDAPVNWVYQDMKDALQLSDILIDYIIHCANSTSSKFYVECPVENINTAYLGTNNLLEYARKRKVKSMVYLSSLESYGTIHDDREITEDVMGYITPTDVRSSYSLGKRAVECLCHCYAREYGVHVKMARLTQTFGAGVSLEDNRVFAQFAKSVIRGKDIVMHTMGESSKPYCYTIDAVIAILYLLFKGVDGEAYNVANSETYISIHDLALFLIDEFNPRCKLLMELRNDMGYAPVTKLNLDTEKLKSLGWHPFYSLKDMYESLIKYYQTIM
ncbi:MAG: NAD(P)-dependent oxidoreductase [Prevotella sp.]|nr:NAD(P)-dependent oxidoreductase [Prevotella sp.]